MTVNWERQWRTRWVANLANYSAYSKPCVELWVRVLEHQGSPAVSPTCSGSNLSPCERPRGNARGRRFSKHPLLIPWACTLRRHPLSAYGCNNWITSWKWPRSSWQSPSSIDKLQVHDPWRTRPDHNEQVQASFSTSRQNDVVGTRLHTWWAIIP